MIRYLMFVLFAILCVFSVSAVGQRSTKTISGSQSNSVNRVFGNDLIKAQESAFTSEKARKKSTTNLLTKIQTPQGTQPSGLAYHDGYFYMSSYILEPGICVIRASDGHVVEHLTPPVPKFKGRYGGLAMADGQLVHVQANNNHAGTFDFLELECLNPTKHIKLRTPSDCSDLAIHENTMWLVAARHTNTNPVAPLIYVVDLEEREVIQTHSLPFAQKAQNHGMTYGGGYLFMSAGNTVVKIDPATFKIVNRTQVPAIRVESLAWDGKNVWGGSFYGGLFRVEFDRDADCKRF